MPPCSDGNRARATASTERRQRHLPPRVRHRLSVSPEREPRVQAVRREGRLPSDGTEQRGPALTRSRTSLSLWPTQEPGTSLQSPLRSGAAVWCVAWLRSTASCVPSRLDVLGEKLYLCLDRSPPESWVTNSNTTISNSITISHHCQLSPERQ